MPATYLNLACGAPTRLARLRAKNPAAPFSARYSKLSETSYGLFRPDSAPPKRARDRLIFADCSLVNGWRDVGHADEIVRLDHKGWFADAFCDETYRGHVWQLPARNGSTLYVAGYLESPMRNGQTDSGGVILETDATGRNLETYDCKEDAARAGDAMAQWNAEEAREYNERWQEARDADEARSAERESLRQARTDARKAITALRELREFNMGKGNRAWELALDALETARDAMRDAIEKIATCNERIAGLDMEGEF